MENLSMCRICLATDVRLCSIASHLQDMYERITSMKFKREDWRPLVACYICSARVQNCYQLRMSCLQSEELLTEMMSSGVLKPQDVLSTNALKTVSVLHMSLGHAIQHNTECHVKEEESEVISEDELDQLNTESIVMKAQEGHAVIDENNQSSHFKDLHCTIKMEPCDVQPYAEDIQLGIEDTIIEENDPDIADTSSQSADNICPKIVKVVLERIDLYDTRTDAEDIQLLIEDTIIEENDPDITDTSSQSADNICPKIVKIVLERIDLNDTRTGSHLLKKPEETENKNIVYDKVTAASNKYKIKDKMGATLHKHEDNKVIKQTSKNSNNESFRSAAHLADTNEKPFQCDICNKCFKSKRYLKFHIYRHSNKRFQCDVCNKQFSTKQYVTYHKYTHTNEKPFQCDMCNKSFTSKKYIRSHMYRHNNKRFQCDVCNKHFSTKQSVTQHRYTHTGEKPYKCEVCNKSFRIRHHVIQHMYTHTDEKRFLCDVCNKCFKSKQDLNAHMYTHTGKKLFQCHVCSKSLSSKYNLTQHMYTHTGEKPMFKCDVCNKGVNTKQNLILHMLTHTGEKRFHCDVCNKCFGRRRYIQQHMYTHR